jgi:Fe-S-cluster containining protein
MELGEATDLADTFITSLLFRVHSLPAGARSGWAGQWWRDRQSRVPLGPALAEAERQLGHFASRRRMDKARDRQVFLEISAIADDGGAGRCPALSGDLCGIYARRPLTCRTVPLHYSRAPSTLQAYLDQFTGTPGHACDTTASAPVIVDGNKVVDPDIGANRDRAIAQSRADRRWKEALVERMDDSHRAAAAGLPTHDAVLHASDNGYATMLPMIVAWRVARQAGLLAVEPFMEICRKQAALIRERLARESSKDLVDLLAIHESELAGLPGADGRALFNAPFVGPA